MIVTREWVDQAVTDSTTGTSVNFDAMIWRLKSDIFFNRSRDSPLRTLVWTSKSPTSINVHQAETANIEKHVIQLQAWDKANRASKGGNPSRSVRPGYRLDVHLRPLD